MIQVMLPHSIILFSTQTPACKAGYRRANTVVLIEATDFYAENISIINLYGAFSNRHTGGLGKKTDRQKALDKP